MESLSEIINRINKETFDPNINNNIESLDNECLVCNGARWILDDTEDTNTRRKAIPVSYTHLTLPTIYSV